MPANSNDSDSTVRMTLYIKAEKMEKINMLAGIFGKRPSTLLNGLIENFLAEHSALLEEIQAARSKYHIDAKK